jgi:hypothetical protein
VRTSNPSRIYVLGPKIFLNTVSIYLSVCITFSQEETTFHTHTKQSSRFVISYPYCFWEVEGKTTVQFFLLLFLSVFTEEWLCLSDGLWFEEQITFPVWCTRYINEPEQNNDKDNRTCKNKQRVAHAVGDKYRILLMKRKCTRPLPQEICST